MVQVGCISVAKQVFYNDCDLFLWEMMLKLALPMLRDCVTASEVLKSANCQVLCLPSGKSALRDCLADIRLININTAIRIPL